ncbi:hypothetical protein GUJ93_ZPchr0001g32300 [Zizania palustris]|uniref:Uncharacterized protein n=1 Tax=Zizania palustris TaxID=103762 RepID=A0A8J5VD12_ZIZPA|nr:hypothetical protein GUJ93_ZPchr0001g32300 [Zizania palustris]
MDTLPSLQGSKSIPSCCLPHAEHSESSSRTTYLGIQTPSFLRFNASRSSSFRILQAFRPASSDELSSFSPDSFEGLLCCIFFFCFSCTQRLKKS